MLLIFLVVFIFIFLAIGSVVFFLAWRLGFHLTLPRAAAMGAGSLLAVAMLGFAAARDNPALQIAEMEGYTAFTRQPRRAVQVDLAKHRSYSQYRPEIVSPAAGDFGMNACGLIAPAQAVVTTQNPTLAGTQPGFNAVFTLMSQIRARAVLPGGKPAYQGATGIQPSALVRALRESPLGDQYEIEPRNAWSLSEMYQDLLDGRIVIVDIRVRQQSESPSTAPDTFAHFARVLGIDQERREIYIENTLDQHDGKAYWTLSLEEFMETWGHPETLATNRPSQDDPTIREENVTDWAVVMRKKE